MTRALPPSTRRTAAAGPPALRVGLVGMAERTRAALAWHFDHARSRRFVEVAAGERAEAVIVDADHPESFAALRAFAVAAARDGGAPPAVVVLAFGEPDPALAALAAHVVPKPVTAESLDAAARALRDGTVRAPAERAASAPETSPEPAPRRTDDAGRGAADAARAHLRDEVLCGAPGAIEAALAAHARDGAAPTLFYDPSAHLGALIERELGAGSRAGRTAPRGLTIEMPHIELFVLPDVDRVYTSAALGSVATVRATFAPIAKGEARVLHHAGGAMGPLIGRVRALARSGYTLDAFAWLCALMSSRGRLPAGLDRAAPARLIRWPNLTRLEPVPHAIEIAALWSAAPLSIEAVTRATGVEPRFVHAFHNGARALGLFEPDPAATPPRRVRSRVPEAPRETAHG